MISVIIGWIFGIVIFLIGSYFYFVPYSTHKSMVKRYTTNYAYGTFNSFIREFYKRKWYRDSRFRESHFGAGAEYVDSEIHASIIKFSGVGMVLDPLSYLRFKIWERKNALPKSNNSKEYKDYWK